MVSAPSTIEPRLRLNEAQLVEDGLRFFPRQSSDEGGRVFVGAAVFGDICGDDLEFVASLGEEFLAARRG